MKLSLILSLFALLPVAAQAEPTSGLCAPYAHKPEAVRVFSLLAKKMALSEEEFCSRPGLAAIHFTTKNIVNEKLEVIPHYWATLHYGEYSCQYFVRQADFVATAQNCYNTW